MNMRIKSKAPKGTKHPGPKRPGRAISADRALTSANTHCLWTYGMNLCAGMPRRLSLPEGQRWIVAILYSPGVGPVGEVGLVAVDSLTGEVLGCTPRDEVLEGARRLARGGATYPGVESFNQGE